MQEERRLAVLRAIVEDYVATEPVGSKALVERHGLGVSPATVRNDMAALEEEGFITQPHTARTGPRRQGLPAVRRPADHAQADERPSAARSPRCSTAPSTSTTSCSARCGCWRSSPGRSRSCSTPRSPSRSGTSSWWRWRRTGLHRGDPQLRWVEQRVIELEKPVADDDLADLRMLVNRSATGRIIAEAVTGLRHAVPPSRIPPRRR